MEIVSIALLIAIVYLLQKNKSHYTSRIERLEVRIMDLQKLLQQNVFSKPAEPTSTAPVNKPEEVKRPPDPLPIPKVAKDQGEVIANSLETIPKPVKAIGRPVPQRPAYKAPEPELSFFERYPDLEKFIGENLINKIGIAILVLAIGFFVKYAIDNNWVGPVGRVAIGVVFGGILIGIAHRMRNSYKAFSSVLVGGGLAILYFTITLAYHQFHLFNQLTSLIILIAITCFAVVLSLLYDKQELAVIALVGGLSSPFMVSSGEANYVGLFTYIVLLNVGMLVIAYYKSWRILNATAFGLTVLVFCLILSSLTGPTYLTGFVYASILYLLFFWINVANNIKENRQFIASDFSILLVNTSLYFAAGLYLLTVMHHENMRGLFSVSLAVINLLLSFALFKNKRADSNILYLLIGITLTFISLTAPIQLNGHYITMFWAAETVLLYWLYLKSKIQLMKLASLIIWAAMIISLLMDWGYLYRSSALTLNIIANKGFITTLMTAISSYLMYLQIIKDENKQIYQLEIPADVYRYASFILLFMSGLLEVNHQFLNRYPNTDLNVLYLLLYVPAFVYVFYFISKRIGRILQPWIVNAVIIMVCVAVYLLSISIIFNLEYVALVGHKLSANHFYAHFLGAVFMAILLYHLVLTLKDNLGDDVKQIATWICSAVIVTFLSLEICLAFNLLFYSPTTSIDRIETVYVQVGLPILWALCSFALMILGMQLKVQTLRIISLTLFSITLVKLFAFDIQGIPPAGKIAAFFCLGVILLIISFMYQKVKKILVDGDKKEADV
ncbi:hypothetical protein ADIARSV_1346 [Arcticibacter svalbardensis MN12-7]|uniref:DUF2339 domain-containing protein n=1 Tax=Arcticibacter svalbardensis MN12-7 TaxID=1150600 RepID=R9GUJ0_9SPHI|nr:DUF2339 domain-containing protein [Arcticibacter svalbardensis]EOR95527.1 hypothetical protein ADIARSV_1346 [Arcticibacter svalbardensis MN12-7]